jgi:hypothetical protein
MAILTDALDLSKPGWPGLEAIRRRRAMRGRVEAFGRAIARSGIAVDLPPKANRASRNASKLDPKLGTGQATAVRDHVVAEGFEVHVAWRQVWGIDIDGRRADGRHIVIEATAGVDSDQQQGSLGFPVDVDRRCACPKSGAPPPFDAFIVTDGSYTTWWSQRTGAPSPA